MWIYEHYENLFQFLGGLFPDRDIAGLSEEDIMNEYIHCSSEDDIKAIICDINNFLHSEDSHIYWEEVGDLANMNLENYNATVNWLGEIVVRLNNKMEIKYHAN